MFENSKHWYKGNLHMHTSLSDGQKTPDEARQFYREAGYDFISITDHWHMSKDIPAEKNSGLLELSGAEYDTGDMVTSKIFHILGIGMDKPALQTPDRRLPPEEIVKAIRAQHGLAILAHPHWSLMDPGAIRSLNGISGAEVYNSLSDCAFKNGRRADSSLYFDLWAEKGIYMPAVADDDSHYYMGEQTMSWIWVNSSALTKPAIMKAIAEGDFYASQGPRFESVRRDGNTLHVCCRDAEKAIFVSNCIWDEQRVQDVRNGAASYTFSKIDTYVRIELMDSNGKLAWFSPVKK